MTVNNDTKVVLTSMEDEKGNKRSFEISYDAASLSEYVRDSYVEPESDIEKVEIPVLRVKGDCLEKVVDFMVHYHEEKMKDIPTPLGGNSFNEVSAGVGVGVCVRECVFVFVCMRESPGGLSSFVHLGIVCCSHLTGHDGIIPLYLLLSAML